AVSEACAAALATRDKTGTPLRIRLSLQADGLKVDIEDGGGPPGGEFAVVLGDGLVQGLFPETSTPSNDHGRRDISFKVSLGAAGSSRSSNLLSVLPTRLSGPADQSRASL